MFAVHIDTADAAGNRIKMFSPWVTHSSGETGKKYMISLQRVISKEKHIKVRT